MIITVIMSSTSKGIAVHLRGFFYALYQWFTVIIIQEKGPLKKRTEQKGEKMFAAYCLIYQQKRRAEQ